jgi:hypothetical protein
MGPEGNGDGQEQRGGGDEVSDEVVHTSIIALNPFSVRAPNVNRVDVLGVLSALGGVHDLARGQDSLPQRVLDGAARAVPDEVRHEINQVVLVHVLIIVPQQDWLRSC